jgi:uncharacterized membrane protein
VIKFGLTLKYTPLKVFQELFMAKKSQRILTAILLALLLTSIIFVPALAQNEDGQIAVRAVLFYSPTCPHCEQVIQNFLPPILEQYGDQLKIVAINTMLPKGQELFEATIDYYKIPDERVGVPTMVVSDVIMVGGGEIPAQFPELVAEGLADGGVDWPEIPGLAEVVAGVQFSSQPTGKATINEDSGNMTVWEKFMRDPVANTIAVLVLIFMVAAIIGVVISFTKPVPEKDFWPKWVIPVLSVLGIGVAFYLTYVETSGVEAVCGPVGDCNTVQLSPYAVLFGVLPVGLLGIIGYALILAGWALYTFGPKNFRWTSAIAVWGMAFFGTLFSIYLTFLEPFVIGATCMWCISSAIFQTVIFMAATGPAKRAWQEDDYYDEDFEDEEDDLEEAKQNEEQEEVVEAETANIEDEVPIAEPEEVLENSAPELEDTNKAEENATEE